MPLFKDAPDVYAHLGALFADLSGDADAAGAAKSADTIVQLQFTEPESTVTVKLLGAEDVAVEFGPTTWRPEVVLAMTADIAHRLFLGRTNPTLALARNQVRAGGPTQKVLAAIPPLLGLVPRYRARIDAAERADLVIN